MCDCVLVATARRYVMVTHSTITGTTCVTCLKWYVPRVLDLLLNRQLLRLVALASFCWFMVWITGTKNMDISNSIDFFIMATVAELRDDMFVLCYCLGEVWWSAKCLVVVREVICCLPPVVLDFFTLFILTSCISKFMHWFQSAVDPVQAVWTAVFC